MKKPAMPVDRRWKLTLGCVLAGLPYAAQAQFELVPYVGVKGQYEDNVFRYRNAAEAEAARGDRKRSDTSLRYEGGLTSSYAFGLQKIAVTASANKTEYDRFKELDYEGHGINGAFNWQVGSWVSGDIVASDRRDLQTFDNTDTDERSLRDQTDGALTVKVKLLQDYEIRPRVGGARVRHSREQSRQQDIDEEFYAMALSYVGRGTMSIGVEGVFKQGEFIRRDPQDGAVEEFDETTLQLVGAWAPSSVTAISYTIGSSRRDNSGINVDDDSAVVGSLSASRAISVKTSVYGGAYRSIFSASREGESTVIGTGLNAGATWKATELTSVNGYVYYRWDDYQNSVISDADRTDKVKGVNISATYQPRTWLSISPDVSWEDRTSEQNSEEYDAFQAGLQVRLLFPLR